MAGRSQMSLVELAVLKKKCKPGPCPIQTEKVITVMLTFSEVSQTVCIRTISPFGCCQMVRRAQLRFCLQKKAATFCRRKKTS